MDELDIGDRQREGGCYGDRMAESLLRGLREATGDLAEDDDAWLDSTFCKELLGEVGLTSLGLGRA